MRSQFAKQGFLVVVQKRQAQLSYLKRCAWIFRDGLKITPRKSVVIMSEFGNSYAWVAKILSLVKSSVLVVDGFIGMYETHIQDRETFSRWSAQSVFYRLMDSVALRSADLYIIDTDLRAQEVMQISARTKVLPVPVGAPDWAVPSRLPPNCKPLKLLYYGNYTKLHAVESLLQCLTGLEDDVTLEIVLIGDLGFADTARKVTSRFGPNISVQYLDVVAEDRLASFIDDCDVVVGVFGTSTKARSVIANKVWQGLCAGRYVLTQQSLALEEISDIAAPLLRQVDVEDVQSVRSEIKTLNSERIESIEILNRISYGLSTYAESGRSEMVNQVQDLLSVRSSMCSLVRRTRGQ
ncbi:hypothetical protein CH272_11530 [Rhodococcus sp. 05-340-1]|nr:hypothetical protein CH271_25105 [Rhodococcus sp. 05-340-2]OZD78335.1 hypothetical protein CH272_11530 [Rhodococcus sp. 05-340-1]